MTVLFDTADKISWFEYREIIYIYIYIYLYIKHCKLIKSRWQSHYNFGKYGNCSVSIAHISTWCETSYTIRIICLYNNQYSNILFQYQLYFSSSWYDMCQWAMTNQGFPRMILFENPWHCNGPMLWLQTSLCTNSVHVSPCCIRQPRGIIIGVKRLMGHSPEKGSGYILVALNEPFGPLFTMKTLAHWSRYSHYKPAMVVRPVIFLNPYF